MKFREGRHVLLSEEEDEEEGSLWWEEEDEDPRARVPLGEAEAPISEKRMERKKSV